MAAEYLIGEMGKEYKVTANAVLPGIIDTEANREAMPKENSSNRDKPETIGKNILFLCSEDANDISGAAIPVFAKS